MSTFQYKHSPITPITELQVHDNYTGLPYTLRLLTNIT